jgi:hypothetical protein
MALDPWPSICDPPALYDGLAPSEADLVRLWEGQRFPAGALVSHNGLALRVAYRGRLAGGPGPDFRDAVIAAGGREWRGDVELHVAASAFRQHGHHRDPAYDNLILHVVFWDDEGGGTRLACGRSVPTLALAPWVARRSDELRRWLARPARWQEPCRTALARLGPAAVAAVLEEAGDARFREKADALAAAMAAADEEEVLYQGLLEGLGYSRNRDPFRRLAEDLPWQVLRRLLTAERPQGRVVAAEAALLGTAGFLPTEVSADPYVAALQERWWDQSAGQERQDAKRKAGETSAPTSHLPPPTSIFLPWELTGRPQNHPARRLAGAARLLVRHVDGGLLAGLLAALREELSALADALQAQGDGYWRDHYDLTSDPSRLPAGLIGPGRAGELAVNIVLPFARAWAESHNDDALAEAALAAYRRHPRTSSYGLLRSLSAALGSRATAGARRQQGMLHLFRRYCRRGGCADGGGCPLS